AERYTLVPRECRSGPDLIPTQPGEGRAPAYIATGVFCVETATHLPFSFTQTRENRMLAIMLFPFCVPFCVARPITTAVFPYTRMFKSDCSRYSNLRAPDLKPSRIWAFVT